MKLTPLLILAGSLLFGLSLPARAELPASLGPLDAKVILVDFWASWCAPCRRSFPWMNVMHEKYADQGLHIIAVNLDKDRALADEFLAETPAGFALHYDPTGGLAEEFGVLAMPSSFVLDGDGNQIAAHFGFKLDDRAEYEQAIVSALESAGARKPLDSNPSGVSQERR